MTAENILKTVVHPAKDQDIVSLGMVNRLQEEAGRISFQLVFPKPDPLADSLKAACKKALEAAFPHKEIQIVEVVKDAPKQGPVQGLGKEELAGVKHIIAVASGKGGVGKSTVAVNLAVALARQGWRVGLADADIYGPSIPKMTQTQDIHPMAAEDKDKEIILPIQKYGIKWMSIGYFVPQEQALVWRGPMAANALKQMILQVRWGELDYLLIDLPPGTGDIQISLVQDVPLSGAVVVSTPQSLALADVEKSVNMFRHKDLRIPIIGLVENMAWFTPKELPENKYYIFGKGGTQALADKYGLPLLAQIPLVQSICESGDSGKPLDFPSAAFETLADEVVRFLDEQPQV